MFKNLKKAGLMALAATGMVMADPPANQTDTQQYNVNVASVFSIDAPFAAAQSKDYVYNTADGESTLGNTGTDVTFDEQVWKVQQNHHTGATVNFVVTPFLNSTVANTNNESYFRRAKLDIIEDNANRHGGKWNTTTATDTTAAASNNDTAQVTVASTGPGGAKVKVNLTFLAGSEDQIAAGTYTTTVTGTISANP